MLVKLRLPEYQSLGMLPVHLKAGFFFNEIEDHNAA